MKTNKKIDLLWDRLKGLARLTPNNCPKCGHRTLCEKIEILYKDDKPLYASPADMGDLDDCIRGVIGTPGFKWVNAWRCLTCGTIWKESLESSQVIVEFDKKDDK